MSLRSARVLPPLLLLTVLVGMGLAQRWDAHRRLVRVQDMVTAQGRAIADIMAEASSHGLDAHNRWRKEVSLRLLNNALWLGRENERGLGAAELDQLAQALGLAHVRMIDADGRLEAAAGPDEAAVHDPLPAGFLAPLLSGETPVRVLGFRTGGSRQRRYAAAAARPDGGVVVVEAAAEDLMTSQSELGPGHLIRALGAGHGILYLAIQDEHGIQAASGTVTLLPWLSDPALAPLRGGVAWVAHEKMMDQTPVLEVARTVDLPSGTVLLRVGMGTELLREFRANEKRHTYVSMGVVAASLILVSSLLLAWQRQGVLDREVVKISRRLAAREAEARRMEKLAAMGSLASGVAHQVRNPLNGIHMIAQVLARNPALPPAVREQAGHIQDESRRIEDIVQQFLEFTRPRRPVPEEVDLASLVREAVKVQEPVLAGKGVALSAYAPGCHAWADPTFVIEVLENLVRNAGDACDEGGRVMVSVVDDGEWAELEVADDGVGVSPEDRERVFDLYFTTRPQGSGLGLSLAAQMVVAMGGEIRLDERPGLDGRGARFVVRLPRREPRKTREND